MWHQIKRIVLTIFLLPLIIFVACSNNIYTENIYEPSDLNLIKWKNKGGFEVIFPESNFARWGYVKGREVAIILYDDVPTAKLSGKLAGQEQTEMLEEIKTDSDSGDSGSFFGPKVERTGFRGFSGAALFRGECPRREPLYTVFQIDGNALFMFEPLRTEDNLLASQRLKELLILLNDRY